jgi:hypothetical protein
MDKLTILNRALSATGNSQLLILNDGSDEAVAAETAFDRAIDYLMAFHNIPFATKVAPFLHAMQYPPDCWHFIAIKDAVTDERLPCRIVEHKIHVMVDTGISAFYVTRPPSSAAPNWHPATAEALTLLVEAELYQGLNEDEDMAKWKRSQAESMLTRAAGRVEQQSSARNVYRKVMGIKRRSRKA